MAWLKSEPRFLGEWVSNDDARRKNTRTYTEVMVVAGMVETHSVVVVHVDMEVLPGGAGKGDSITKVVL